MTAELRPFSACLPRAWTLTLRSVRYLGVALVVALSVVTPAAAAEEPPSPARPAAAKGTGDAEAAGEEKASGEVRWDPEWTQAGAGHVAVVAAAGAVALAGQFIAPDRTKVWSQRYDVDEDVRQGLRLPTSAGRATAKTASDFLAALDRKSTRLNSS